MLCRGASRLANVFCISVQTIVEKFEIMVTEPLDPKLGRRGENAKPRECVCGLSGSERLNSSTAIIEIAVLLGYFFVRLEGCRQCLSTKNKGTTYKLQVFS
jgi:hypothetical protein